MCQRQPYDIIVQTVYAGKEVAVDPRCNSWTAVNTGDTLAMVNGFPLLPFPPGHPELSGAAIEFDGNCGEIYTGRIWVVFADAPLADPQVQIIQKFYKPN